MEPVSTPAGRLLGSYLVMTAKRSPSFHIVGFHHNSIMIHDAHGIYALAKRVNIAL
jgi:hypothetical protein